MINTRCIIGLVMTVVLWFILPDATDGGDVIKVDSVVHALAFSPNGKILVAGSEDGTVSFWNIPKMTPVLRAFKDDRHVDEVSFIRNDKTILTQGLLSAYPFGINLQVWNIETGLAVADQLGPVNEGTQRAALAPDYKSMAVIRFIDPPQAFVCELVRFDAKESEVLPVAPLDKKYRLETIAYSPDGKTVAASGGVLKTGDWLVMIWDISVRPIRVHQFRWRMPGDTGGTKLAFSSDGVYLAAGHFYETVRIIDIKTKKVIRNMAGGSGPMLFLPRPVATLIVSDGKRLLIWSPPLTDMQEFVKTKLPFVTSVAAHPNGQTLAIGGYGETDEDGNLLMSGDKPLGMIELLEVPMKVKESGDQTDYETVGKR